MKLTFVKFEANLIRLNHKFNSWQMFSYTAVKRRITWEKIMRSLANRSCISTHTDRSTLPLKSWLIIIPLLLVATHGIVGL